VTQTPTAACEVHVYAGTGGHSAWFSDDRGVTWVHPNSHSGMYLEARVWSIASHSATPERLFAGSDMGISGGMSRPRGGPIFHRRCRTCGLSRSIPGIRIS
jgi:hypothetical protein